MRLFNTGIISRKIPTVTSSEIVANISSNVSLSCWIDCVKGYCPEKTLWKFNDETEPLPESGKKYKVELHVKDTNNKCQKEYILSILNVTESDEGTYNCHWLCKDEKTRTAAIDLKVDNHRQTGKVSSMSVLSLAVTRT